MEGWVWGPGDSGTTHAAPPALALDDVCEPAPSPAPSPSPPPGGGGSGGGGSGNGGSGGGGSGGGSSTAGGSGGGTTATPTPSPGARASAHADRGVTPTSSATTIAGGEIIEASPVGTVAAADAPGRGGPPAGALIALIAVAALGAAGWFSLRRRRADDRP